MKAQPLTFMALALVLLATTAPRAAETCYQDDTGRIVKRRRPGYTEVPCPDEDAQPGASAVGRSRNAQPQEDTGRAPRRRVIERAPPAYVSPIPRPGLADYVESVPVPDRWRIVDTLGYQERWCDPYNRNVLKADRPVHGDDWFFNLGVISDTVYELREVPTPVGGISTDRPGGIDVFGSADQWAAVAEPRGRVRLLQGRHGLQAARLRVPLHAGLQLQLRRARRRCRA